MTKHIFVALLIIVPAVVSVQAQGLQPRRTLARRTQRQMDSAALLESTTNEAGRVWRTWPNSLEREEKNQDPYERNLFKNVREAKTVVEKK